MAAPIFQFDETRNAFLSTLKKTVNDGHRSEDITEVPDLAECFSSLAGSEVEKKSTLDQSFKEALQSLVKQDAASESYLTLIQMSVIAVKTELCFASTPFILLSDLCDTMTLDRCEEIFTYIEQKVKVWKADQFYQAGKNYFLRMCNNLLRRSSKSQNTIFCGRIQVFMAHLFPLSEMSALNLMGHFNVENVTIFTTKAEEFKTRQDEEKEREESMDIEEGEMDDLSSSIPIDYNLYKKFWSLQDYFRKPAQCYEKIAWKMFSSYSEEVLSAFSSFKLDDLKSNRKKLDKLRESKHAFFAKYLTSEKLLDLQLSDSNFRRYILVQFLILFQYLNATVKFKSTSLVLTDEQSEWIKQASDRVYQLLRETPPDGEKFAESIEHILMRDENWSNWKNKGCQSFSQPSQGETKTPVQSTRKRSVGEDLKATGGKIVKMGNSELTRLWNLERDNMEACAAEKRIFLPNMEEFFEECIEQADPDAMIEETYKLVRNENFAWRSLRLLARKSPHFFTQLNQQGKSLPVYLESMVAILAKELPHQPSSAAEEVKTEVGEEEEIKDQAQDDDNDLVTTEEKVPDPVVVSKEQITKLSAELGSNWKMLATELNFPEDDITYVESETSDVDAQGLKMLTIWMETEGDIATPGALKNALKEIGLAAMATAMFGS